MTGADAANPMLLMMLSASVPLRIHQLLTHPHRDSIQRRWARRAADEVASHGDDLMFGGPKRGGAAAVFNRLTEGLAAGALCPGGVTFLGVHWCVEHPGGIQGVGELTCTSRILDDPPGVVATVLWSDRLNGTPPAGQVV